VLEKRGHPVCKSCTSVLTSVLEAEFVFLGLFCNSQTGHKLSVSSYCFCASLLITRAWHVGACGACH